MQLGAENWAQTRYCVTYAMHLLFREQVQNWQIFAQLDQVQNTGLL